MRKKKAWHKAYCNFIKIFKRKVKCIYLGEEVGNRSLVLSNHVGASGPLSFELFNKRTFRYWGTHEMNGKFKEVYAYLTNIYFTQKKHIKKWISKIIGVFAAPFMRLFYKGLDLIPTYHDARFYRAIKDSYNTLMEGQSVVIFPEASEKGYFSNLKAFHAGFVVLLKYCFERGLDFPIYIAYLHKKKRIHLFDKPILYSEIKDKFQNKEEVAKYFCARCNELGKMIEEGNIPYAV